MVLGAGVYQAPLYDRIRERGWRSIAVSPPGPYPGLQKADEWLCLDTRDRDAVTAAARKERISAIVTTGTDVAMPALGAVCDAMNLPGVGLEAAIRGTDKIRMKEAFRLGGVRTSDFRPVRSLEEAMKAAAEIGYPVMLKIPDKSGSRGITRVNGPEGMRDAWDFSRRASNAEYLLTESFVEGTEFGVDALIQHGRILAVIPHEKRVYFSGRTGVPSGHLCPAGFSGETLRKIRQQTELVCQALGLDECAVNLDAILTPEGDVSIIEAAARCGGTGIPEVISGYLGTDWYDVILDLAMGKEIILPAEEEIRKIRRAAASLMIRSSRPGTLKKISYAAKGMRREAPEYRDERLSVSLNVKPGDPVSDFVNGTERLGQAVFLGETVPEILQAEKEFLRDLRIELENDD